MRPMRSNRPVLRREALTELSPADLDRLAGGTRSIECFDPSPAIASLRLETCIALSIACYSWHTEEC